MDNRYRRPTVESDEEDLLAKEHVRSVVSASFDEEPKCRGEIDQEPILLPVHEHNHERAHVHGRVHDQEREGYCQ